MTEEAVRQQTTPRRRSPTWQLLRGVFPEVISLGQVGLIAVVVVGCALVAHHVMTQQRESFWSTQAQITAHAVADRLSHLQQSGKAPDAKAIAALAGELSVASLHWVDATGTDCCNWSGALVGRNVAPIVTASVPVVGADGEAAGTVTIGLPATDDTSLNRTFFGLYATVLTAALLACLALYRLTRRQIRPISVIQTGLEDYAAGVERELQTLHMSDAFGRLAQGWNRLIEEVTRIKEQSEHAGTSNAGDALSRFKSRTLRDTLERIPVGVVRFGEDERIHYANSSAAHFLGTSADKLTGQNVRDALGVETETLLGAGRRGARAAMDWEREGPGEVTTLRVELLPPREGIDLEPILLIQDVTDLREVERTRNSFLYHVTHELRTPLTNIQAYAETLSRLDFDDEQTRKECYNVIVSETKRLSDLVEDILSISQMEVGAMRLDAGDVDMIRLLRTMVQDNLAAADEKGVELTLSLPPKLPRAHGDKRRLAVLLNNLIGNAIKYTPRDGHVSVRATHDERRMRIQVVDTGLGIAPEDCAKVFEKFYRVGREEVQSVKGTGLGLAIAREVARLHGGDILLDSEPGKGSTFTLELPLRAADVS